MEKPKYTGINRIAQSEALQQLIDIIHDGTFSDFVKDWKWIFTFSKKYKWIIVLYTVVGILGSTLGIGSAYVGRTLINIIVDKQTEKLWLLVAIMLGSVAFSLVMSSVSSRIFTKISIYVNNDIQAAIFDRIIDAKWSDLSKYPSGDLLNRFNGDVGTIAGNAIGWIPNLIVNIYTFALTFIVLLKMDVMMAWIAILSAPFLLVMSHYIMRKMQMYRKRVLELQSGMMSFEVETFYNFDMIKSFGIIGYYSKKLREWQKTFKEFSLDYNKFEIKTKIMLTVVSTIVSMVAFGYCLFLLWNGKILYGDMTFFLQQRSNLSNKFNNLVGTIPGMLNSAISVRRVRELVDLPREEHDPEAYEKMKEIAKDGVSIKMKDISFGYNEDKNVYNNLSFEANPGEIIAVLASSGGGKTTLMRIMLGMLEPQNGAVELVGSDGEPVPVNADLRRLFAYVPQGNTVLSGTIAENMRMVRPEATDEEIIDALKTACAWEFVSLIPDGINGTLGEKGRGISEGQAQRLAIARALVRNCPILLLDEATSALDLETEERVLQNIIKRHPAKVIIVSTHRPGALKLCQKLYRLSENGVESVSYEEAVQASVMYYDMAQTARASAPDPRAFMPKQDTKEQKVELLTSDPTENMWGI